MKITKNRVVYAALLAGSVYALAAMALPGNAVAVDVYTTGGVEVGEKVVFDPCRSGMLSWGSQIGTRKRVYIPCSDDGWF